MNRLETLSLRAFTVVGAMVLAGTALAGNNQNKWQQMDTNGDGMVSAQEHDSAAATRFQEADADGDGSITAAEMDAAHAAKRGGHGKGSAGMMQNGMMQKMDTDGDGAVSAEEHAAAAKEMMAKHDTDGDGNISQAEFEARMNMQDEW